METIETIIVGGGQAGLATSYHLKQLGGHPHHHLGDGIHSRLQPRETARCR